jgi:hypothetical protein
MMTLEAAVPSVPGPKAGPPTLFSWSVVIGRGDPPPLGAVGVTDDRARALTRLGAALRDAPPGARGLVHRVLPSMARVGYLYDGLIARGTFDPAGDAVVWEELPDVGSWRLGARFACGRDAIPPEGVAAGLADLESERARRRSLGLPADSTGVVEL